MGKTMKKNWFTVKQLYPNIWGIGEFLHFEKAISYLFVGHDNALLFDSGMGIRNIKKTVKKFIVENLRLIFPQRNKHFLGRFKFFAKHEGDGT